MADYVDNSNDAIEVRAAPLLPRRFSNLAADNAGAPAVFGLKGPLLGLTLSRSDARRILRG
jgi:hypothetical protein